MHSWHLGPFEFCWVFSDVSAPASCSVSMRVCCNFAVCETVAVPAIWQSLLFSCESFLDAAGIFEQHLPGRGKP